MTFPDLQACLDRLGVNLSLRLVADLPPKLRPPDLRAE